MSNESNSRYVCTGNVCTLVTEPSPVQDAPQSTNIPVTPANSPSSVDSQSQPEQTSQSQPASTETQSDALTSIDKFVLDLVKEFLQPQRNTNVGGNESSNRQCDATTCPITVNQDDQPSDSESDDDSTASSEVDDYMSEERWSAFNKLLDSHRTLSRAFLHMVRESQ